MAGTSHTEGHLPYFFLSYARTPRTQDDENPNLLVEKLYKDLRREILEHTFLPASAAGFMDMDMPPGVEWENRLATELATCRVFLPLYSRRYFQSEQCGKEWAAFDLRRRLHLDGRRHIPEVIVPAFWVPVPDFELPDMARSIQFTHPDLGTHYLERGLYGLMKISRYRDHYRSAVHALARRVIEVAEGVRLPPMAPCDYGSIKSAFTRDEERRFLITVLSHTTATRTPPRDARFYGSSPCDWNPYQPEDPRPVARIAADVVRRLGFEPEIGTFEHHRDELLGAGAPNCPAIVLLDVWTVLDPRFRPLLEAFDQADKPWVGVVVPWSGTDAETGQNAPALRAALRALLPAKLAQGRPAARRAVSDTSTVAGFETALRPVVEAAGNSYLRHGRAFPPQVPGSDRPRLWPLTTDDPGPDDPPGRKGRQ
ncbi:TIR-like protein FxsC [Microbispora amethystogenes]|uniref:TIR-like protein FxsC n=1 Tax=Microbispora amethystogenes TaxID=1427754 RepID=UPI00340D984A